MNKGDKLKGIVTDAVREAILDTIPVEPPRLLTVRQFHEKHPAFPEPTIRDFIYKSRDRHSSRGQIPGNGLAPAVYRMGNKVLIDESRFFQWFEKFKAA